MIERVQVFADSPHQDDRDAAQGGGVRSDTDRSLYRWIVAALASTVVMRLGAWAFSWFALGPAWGLTTLALVERSGGLFTPLVPVEWAVAVLGLVAAVVVAAGVRRRPQGWARAARVLGWTLVIDVAVYVVSIGVIAAMNGAFAGDDAIDPYVASGLLIIVASNLALGLIGYRIAGLARPRA